MIVANFALSAEQLEKILDWVQVKNQEALRNQQRTDPSIEHPYTGAIGGVLTYSFTPTNLGMVTKVEHSLTGEILDVTNYHEW